MIQFFLVVEFKRKWIRDSKCASCLYC